MASPMPPDASRASVVTIPTVVTTIIAVVLTLLRLYVRRYVIRMMSWDDFFNVLATLCVIVILGLILAASKYGFGRHMQYVDPARAAYSIKLLRICEFIMILSTIFLKISISLFLKRLFLTSREWKVFFWCFIAFNSITSALDAAVIFPQCTPVELNWDKSVPGHCWSDTAINAVGIAQGSIAAATDFILSTLPIFFLWCIRIPTRVKVGTCGIMALGFASGAFALVRTVLVPTLTATDDPTWDLVDLFLWAELEATFGVIAAAAPSVRPLMGHNSLTTDEYRSKSHSLPLHSLRTGRSSKRDIGHSLLQSREEMAGRRWEGEGSQSQLWVPDEQGIVKTMSVEVVSSQSRVPPEKGNWDLEEFQ